MATGTTGNKATVAVKRDDANREWWIVDLEGQTLGRAASRIATVLRGKHKPSYTPHSDTGDFVIVINAEKAVLTGRKEEQKVYYRHTRYFGGIKSMTAREVRERKPAAMLEMAVRGMLPRGPLGRHQLGKLKVYAGTEHPHSAQQPKPLDLSKI